MASIVRHKCNMFSNFTKRRALNKIVNKLPYELSRSYGSSDNYTIGQLQTTLQKRKYSKKYRGYAYAIFLTLDDAITELGNLEIVNTLRQEVGDLFFGGSTDFNFKVKSNPGAHSNLSNDSIGVIGDGH